MPDIDTSVCRMLIQLIEELRFYVNSPMHYTAILHATVKKGIFDMIFFFLFLFTYTMNRLNEAVLASTDNLCLEQK